MPTLFLAVFIPALLAACTSLAPQLHPGVSDVAAVRRELGVPVMEWVNPDGGRTWEYPQTPEGTVNYMVDFDAAGRFLARRQVLTDENFARVRPGMNRDAVRRLLGRPAHELSFPRQPELVWDWKTSSDPGMDWYFNVHFDVDGRVLRTSRSFVPRERSFGQHWLFYSPFRRTR